MQIETLINANSAIEILLEANELITLRPMTINK